MPSSLPREVSSVKTLWSDLPKRATVLFVGIPTVGLILSQPVTSWLFFQVVHLISAWEWLALVPPSAASYKKDDGDSKDQLQPGKMKFSLAMYLFPWISCGLANMSDDASNTGGLLGWLVTAACFIALVESKNARVCNHLLKGLLLLSLPMQAWNQLSQNFAVTTYLLSVSWNSDTGALLCKFERNLSIVCPRGMSHLQSFHAFFFSRPSIKIVSWRNQSNPYATLVATDISRQIGGRDLGRALIWRFDERNLAFSMARSSIFNLQNSQRRYDGRLYCDRKPRNA